MKKAIASILAVASLLSAVLLFPSLSAASIPADLCYDNWEVCRMRAFQADTGFLRTTLMLTVCDIGLGKCLLTV
ncbi:MAG: hypothetical protein A2W03_01340 [Candidatus Aminicenantes bacterium RBG_16_63_16]|nr:MAG: hypothetical protein A2W03_01340 [Candidatus Aminicenantes bacterium RBG_16_63_16]